MAARQLARSLLALLAIAAGCDGGADDAATTRTQEPGTPEVQPVDDVLGRIPAIVQAVQPSVVAVLRRGGEGSGVVYDGDGVIVTNLHVVEGARTVTVQLASGRRVAGRVRATDERTDLAVLQVDEGDLPAADFAEGLPPVGALAVALGNPLGFENTATAGIVSGLHRSIPSLGRAPALVDLVQTDAPISPGSSGGALVGAEREVIGINVAYLPPQETGAVSVGFAIPSPTVRDVVEQLLRRGEVRHAALGVVIQAVTPELGESFDLGTGVLVLAVEPGGAARKAGVRRGDVIVAFAGRTIEMPEDLYAELREHEPGDRVSLVVVRDGERRQLELTLGELRE